LNDCSSFFRLCRKALYFTRHWMETLATLIAFAVILLIVGLALHAARRKD